MGGHISIQIEYRLIPRFCKDTVGIIVLLPETILTVATFFTLLLPANYSAPFRANPMLQSMQGAYESELSLSVH
mgnify:CR=1 FL=1|jgi:hypothetical protein|tara:strand:- start:2374 stop:2595 length:222 start_codon:yes stop_codon:yes gene_type:complete